MDECKDESTSAELDSEWKARKTQFWNSGFRDGVEEGIQQDIQNGFNAGYANGLEAGNVWGQIRAGLGTLEHFREAQRAAAEWQQDMMTHPAAAKFCKAMTDRSNASKHLDEIKLATVLNHEARQLGTEDDSKSSTHSGLSSSHLERSTRLSAEHERLLQQLQSYWER